MDIKVFYVMNVIKILEKLDNQIANIAKLH
jgi:hypothetical protein